LKQLKVIECLPSKGWVESVCNERSAQVEKEVVRAASDTINQRLTEILVPSKQESEAFKAQVKSLSRQVSDQRDEVHSELNKLRSQGTQFGSQLLLKIEKTDIEALSKRLEAKMTSIKGEWGKQLDAVAGQATTIGDSVSLVKVSLHDEINKLSKNMTKKHDFMCEKIIEIETRACHLRTELSEQTEGVLRLLKSSQAGLQSAIQSESETLRTDFEAWKTGISTQLDLKLNATELAKTKKMLKESISSKASAEEVNRIMEKLTADIGLRHNQTQNELEKCLEALKKEIFLLLRKKTTQKEVEVMLADRLTVAHFEGVMHPLQKRMCELEERSVLVEKKDKGRNSKLLSMVTQELGRVEQAIQSKAGIEDVIRAVASKANTEDFNAILGALQTQIQAKASSENIQRLVAEQEQFNEFFASESIIARYKWKSGQFGNTPFVPLEVECLNTLRENFIWEKNATSLVILNGGLYEIGFGFFSKQRPAAKLYFNNEIVCVCGGFPSQETVKMMGSTAKIGAKDREKEKEKPMALQRFPSNGLTSFDYYLVPDNCKVSLYLVGENIIEGFINVRRL
jgi:hypothetical protein